MRRAVPPDQAALRLALSAAEDPVATLSRLMLVTVAIWAVRSRRENAQYAIKPPTRAAAAMPPAIQPAPAGADATGAGRRALMTRAVVALPDPMEVPAVPAATVDGRRATPPLPSVPARGVAGRRAVPPLPSVPAGGETGALAAAAAGWTRARGSARAVVTLRMDSAKATRIVATMAVPLLCRVVVMMSPLGAGTRLKTPAPCFEDETVPSSP
jgi:hypothetical protein